MAQVGFASMGGNNSYIRIRADAALKQALKAAAKRYDRKEADQARHIIRLALGLVEPEMPVEHDPRAGPHHKKTGGS